MWGGGVPPLTLAIFTAPECSTAPSTGHSQPRIEKWRRTQ